MFIGHRLHVVDVEQPGSIASARIDSPECVFQPHLADVAPPGGAIEIGVERFAVLKHTFQPLRIDAEQRDAKGIVGQD